MHKKCFLSRNNFRFHLLRPPPKDRLLHKFFAQILISIEKENCFFPRQDMKLWAINSRKLKWCWSYYLQFFIDLCRKLEFTSSLAFHGKRLINHIIRTVESLVQDSCSTLCYMEPNCVSYNEVVVSSPPSITKCELNNSTHNEHPQDLKPWPNYSYGGTMVSAFLSKWRFPFFSFPLYC